MIETLEQVKEPETVETIASASYDKPKNIPLKEAQERDRQIFGRKQEIVKKLGTTKNLNHFKAIIFQENQIEKIKFEKDHPGETLPDKAPEEQRGFDLKILRGFVFEELTKHERLEAEGVLPVANELQYLISHPDLFELVEEIGHIRHPDIAYVELDQRGHIIVKGVGEIKLGLLNKRALEQLQAFKGSMEKLARVINKMNANELNSHGLFELGKLKRILEENNGQKSKTDNKNLVEIAENFDITLITPYKRDILYDKNEITKEELDQALKGKKKVESIFSTDDIFQVAEVIYDKINRKKEEKPEDTKASA